MYDLDYMTYGLMFFLTYLFTFALAGLVGHTRSVTLERIVLFVGVAGVSFLVRTMVEAKSWPTWGQVVLGLILIGPFLWAGMRWQPPVDD